MKILSLTVRNFLKVEVAEIAPDGNLVVIAGPNEGGKSSLIGAVDAAFRGADAAPELPIRVGADKAEIIVETGTGADAPRLRVRRVFTAAGTRLEVGEIRPDGATATFKSPQKMLDALYESLAFDPMAFFDLAPAAQAEELSRIVGLNVADLDAEYERVYAERRDINRDLKAMGECPAPEGERPALVDVAALTNRMSGARAKVDAKSRLEDRRNAIKRDIVQQNEKRALLREEIERIERKISEVNDSETGSVASLASTDNGLSEFLEYGDPRETELEILAEMESAESRNAAVREYDAAVKRVEALATLDGTAIGLTTRLANIKTLRAERIAAVDMPLDGLAIEDGTVLFEGVPVSQASTARKLEIGALIGLAKKPRLRVLRIEHGSLLDSRMFERMRAIAEKWGVQWWVERVADEDDGTGFFIEEGRLAERATDDQGSLL